MTGPTDLSSLFLEIGHEKAQSVIDSITSSYAAEGQAHANPMLLQNQPGHAFPPFGFPGGKLAMDILSSFPCALFSRRAYDVKWMWTRENYEMINRN